MQIGIVSDTHDRVPASLHEALRGTDEVVHCGDICRDHTLVELETIAPVAAVHGNCDTRGLFERFPEELVLDRAGLTIAVIHGHRFPLTDSPAVASSIWRVTFRVSVPMSCCLDTVTSPCQRSSTASASSIRALPAGLALHRQRAF